MRAQARERICLRRKHFELVGVTRSVEHNFDRNLSLRKILFVEKNVTKTARAKGPNRSETGDDRWN